MCIFIGQVKEVSQTRILVAPLPGDKQLIVYENNVKSNSAKNAMILPVPSGLEITLIDVSKYPGNVWEECETYFPTLKSFGFGSSPSFGMSEPELAVERIGGYLCSIVPTLEDFIRVSRQTFVLPLNIETILRENYTIGFSFIVCQFDDKTVAPHPIAYTSKRLPDGSCFIPTRHAHGEDNSLVVHTKVSCDQCRKTPITGVRFKCLECQNYDLCQDCYDTALSIKLSHVAKQHVFARMPYEVKLTSGISNHHGNGDKDLFDHTIYLLNSILMALPSSYNRLEYGERFNDQFNAGLSNFAAFLKLPPIASIAKVSINGKYPNVDYKCGVV